MAKRFTETDKWKDTWFRKLQPAEKLLWLYIIDTCDNAGFFELDVEMASFVTKMEEDRIKGAIEGLSEGLIRGKDTEHYYVKNLLKHQLNLPLTPSNNAHKQILRIIISREDDFPQVYKSHLKSIKGLISLPSKGIVKDKVKVVYSEEFDEWWKVYGKGNKQPAFKAFQSQKDKPENLIQLTKNYISYCKSEGRKMLDGQGFLNNRTWKTNWTHSAQGTADESQTEKPAIDPNISAEDFLNGK